MEKPSGSGGGGGGATGCFKCGLPGHWSRDCPSSAPNGPNPNPNPSLSQPSLQNTTINGGSTSWKPPLKKPIEKPKKVPKRVPNLTPERLLSDDGLGYILRHFPGSFKFRGRGHEVSDLGNLIGLYRDWHSQLLPSYSFDQFVQKVEKVGATNRVRLCLRELRDRVANGGDPSKLHEPPLDNVGGFDEPVKEGNNLDVPSFDNVEVHEWTNEADVVMQEEELADEIYNTVTEEPCQSSLTERTANEGSFDPSSLNETPNQVADEGTHSLSKNQINEEQKARIEASRLKALERTAARARMSQAA